MTQNPVEILRKNRIQIHNLTTEEMDRAWFLYNNATQQETAIFHPRRVFLQNGLLFGITISLSFLTPCPIPFIILGGMSAIYRAVAAHEKDQERIQRNQDYSTWLTSSPEQAPRIP